MAGRNDKAPLGFKVLIAVVLVVAWAWWRFDWFEQPRPDPAYLPQRTVVVPDDENCPTLESCTDIDPTPGR